ncbi:MAG: nicotinate-nicotinamide nucleotide adenylyltransferase [Deltaproteobacteria bacterium]|nr:nicotinate-nicotinamide nucleotide adenylyltransferase [Deltaproteobacteria bacterium]
MRIAIFGGSFNPVHLGHLAMVRWVLRRRLVDRVIVVPCWRHPFAKDLAPFAARVTMCRLALARFRRAEVSTLEQRLGGVSYMARTVRALQRRYPSACFSLLIGADVEPELPRWRNWRWLQRHVALIKLPRGPRSPIPNVSATAIRARLAAGQSVADAVPRAALRWLQQHAVF